MNSLRLQQPPGQRTDSNQVFNRTEMKRQNVFIVIEIILRTLRYEV